jgi:hypothetical protein
MAFRVKIRSGSGSFCLEPFGNRGTHAPYCLLVTFFLRWSTARDRRAGAAIRLLRRPGMPPICSPVCFGSPSQQENPIPAGSRSPRKNDDVNIRLPIYYIFLDVLAAACKPVSGQKGACPIGISPPRRRPEGNPAFCPSHRYRLHQFPARLPIHLPISLTRERHFRAWCIPLFG